MRISDCSSDVCSSDVVLGVHAAERRVGEDRGAQLVFGMEIGAADALVDDLLQAARTVETAIHAPFDEDRDDARVLADRAVPLGARSEEHTSELQSLMRISYAVFCLKKKNYKT